VASVVVEVIGSTRVVVSVAGVVIGVLFVVRRRLGRRGCWLRRG